MIPALNGISVTFPTCLHVSCVSKEFEMDFEQAYKMSQYWSEIFHCNVYYCGLRTYNNGRYYHVFPLNTQVYLECHLCGIFGVLYHRIAELRLLACS